MKWPKPKRIKGRKLVLAFIASVAFAFVFGQDAFAQMTYPRRAPVAFEQYAQFESDNSSLILGRIVPLGFSREGLFAYVIEPPDEACGCYFFEFYIQDLKTDRILYNKKLEYQDVPSEKWHLAWHDHGPTFIKKLEAYGIVLSVPKPLQFPLLHASSTIRLELNAQKERREILPEIDVVKVGKVFLSHEKWGKKQVAALSFPHGFSLNYDQGCYFKSPYEDRIAIVVLREDRGWEGPPNTIHPVVIGASLTKGFPSGPETE